MITSEIYRLLFVFSLLTFAQFGHSQTEFLVTLDRTTGEHTAIENLPTVNFIYMDATAYDKDAKRYILRGIDFDGNERLFCVNANTGAIISQPLLPGIIGELHYDHLSGLLYGLEVVDGEMHIITIDIPTATTSLVVDLPVVGFTGGNTFFDEANQHFVLLNSGNFYITNVITGDIEIIPAAASFTSFQYDNTNEKLYGLILDGTTELVGIDVFAGTYSVIADIADPGVLGTIPSFDEINQYYTYASSNFLNTINVITGDILWDPIFPNVEIGENVIECHYDNDTGILYALHWGDEETEIDPPEPPYVLNDTICKGDTGTLTLVGPGDYDWTTVEDPTTILETDNVFNVAPLVTTDYYALNAGDTILAKIVVIETYANFTIADTVGCSPLVVSYTDLSTTSIGSIVEWQWTFSDGTTSTVQHPTHIYHTSHTSSTSLQVLTNHGCISTINLASYLSITPTPNASFSYTPDDIEKEDDVFFTDESLNAETWEWDFGDGNYSSLQHPIHAYLKDSNYAIMLTVSNGDCSDSVIKKINLKGQPSNEEVLFYIPNAFTPNSGHLNNTFFPVFTSGYDPYNYHLTLFNRWGEIVFESYDATVGWDGTYGGQLVSDDTFIWQVEFQLSNSPKKEVHRGHVSVLK